MTTPVQRRSGLRLLRGLGALTTLAAGLVGVPWVLVVLAGNPLPSHLSLDGLWRTLSTPDDGTVLIRLVAVVAWTAWLVFTAAVILETISLATRRRITITVPGLGGMQKVAGTLVLLILAAVALPPPAAAAPAPAPPGRAAAAAPTDRAAPREQPEAGTAPHRDDRTAGGEGRSSEDVLVHVVRPGDDLWTLAQQYYGQGTGWRRIARANPSVLTGGPDRLEPGWRLRIPGARPAGHHVRVEGGETLSSIAEREYGDAALWTRIYQANRDRIQDPDLVEVGMLLRVPPIAPGTGAAAGTPATSGAGHPTAPTDRDRWSTSGHSVESGGSSARRPPAGRPAPTTSAPTRTTSAGPSAAQDAGRPARVPDAGGPSAAPDAGGPPPPATDRPAGTAPSHEPMAAGTVVPTAADAARAVAGIGGLLAAAVLTGLLARRRLQLQGRPVGRRIPHPPAQAQQVETALGLRQDPLGLDQLDLVLRAVGLDRRRRGLPAPDLRAARVGPEEIRFRWARLAAPAPVGFTIDGEEWRLSAADADLVLEDPALADAPQPYPGLASVGTDGRGHTVMVNLESTGLLSISGGDGASRRGSAEAMVTELAFNPWTDEVVVTVVGADHGLVAAVNRYNIGRADDLDALLDRWERRATLQRTNLDQSSGDPGAVDLRIDPDRGDPWVPEIAFVMERPEPGQTERLRRLLATEPRVTLGAVLLGDVLLDDVLLDDVLLGDEAAGPWRLNLGDQAEPDPRGRLEPLGWRLSPQSLAGPVAGAVRELIACTGSPETRPAPWWAADFAPGAGPAHAARATEGTDRPDGDNASPGAEEPESCPVDRDEVDRDEPDAGAIGWPSAAARLQIHAADRSPDGVESPGARTSSEQYAGSEEPVTVPNPYAGPPAPAPRHPTVLLLGPIQLLGAAGVPPNRAGLQCIEYCTWLLEHPGSTARAMAAALIVAEGTRRSNMSRLRSWLGADDRGEPYLPDAYSGRILLSPLVTSDWHRLQILTANGINRTSTEGLCHALDLVRGAPLADAAPGQWHWAEEMRTDMVSVIRDIGIGLSARALAGSDIDLARWAAARSLTAAPQDESLMAARIRTEHQAGNPAEVERLALQISAGARSLGIDLLPETVDLLQQVMEGRLRARA